MTTEALIVIAIRLVVPLSILRWPLAGALLAVAADALDIIAIQLLDFGGVGDYHRLDKFLDGYYLTLEVAVAQSWPSLYRRTATVLYAYRMLGVVLFEVTNARVLLLVFPNLFENVFIFYLVVVRFFPSYPLTRRRLALWLGVLLIPKLTQEYILHYAKLLDDHVAVDIIADMARAVIDWSH